MNNKLSFFNIFNYSVLETEANDGLYIYEDVEIIEDIKVGERVLTKGQRFDAVWFSFITGVFAFIVWEKINKNHYTPKNCIEFTREELKPWYYFEKE